MANSSEANEPQTWIVGGSDDGGFSTRCLLALEERFALPASVIVRHGQRWRREASVPRRVITFVEDPPGAGSNFLGILRDHEAAALVDTPRRRSATVAIGVARGRPTPVDDAVKLAVTTLIDWGHMVVVRT